MFLNKIYASKVIKAAIKKAAALNSVIERLKGKNSLCCCSFSPIEKKVSFTSTFAIIPSIV